eukprot:scaffold1527_cov143-Pinguiococcus_pyrenoidosus.AAC.9
MKRLVHFPQLQAKPLRLSRASHVLVSLRIRVLALRDRGVLQLSLTRMAKLRCLVLVDQRYLRAVDHQQSLTELLVGTGAVAKAHALDPHVRRAERDLRWAAGAPTHPSHPFSTHTYTDPDLFVQQAVYRTERLKR